MTTTRIKTTKTAQTAKQRFYALPEANHVAERIEAGALPKMILYHHWHRTCSEGRFCEKCALRLFALLDEVCLYQEMREEAYDNLIAGRMAQLQREEETPTDPRELKWQAIRSLEAEGTTELGLRFGEVTT